ncbi:DMT family transporter [Paracoccus aminophilus]|uniref:Guanidinium exporter n=1 Tax=Paracoccus aminophilus JCM 7686 TaxID=1367847 RepID=S5YCH5_PARAH|nr:SMR family transporter [Paracoccus aminophilus]AGT09133.1 membrane transporter [Paracoccus aminophilus JCM 7686]
MAWIYLLIAGVCEVIWAVAMKESNGFSKLWPTVVTAVGMAISIWFLALAMRTLPLGTAYTIWTGIGAIGSFVIGILWMHEPATAMRLLAAALIISGLVLMKVATPH